jgi:MurNAc alpha-1-phosphate uridylyltransferase
MKDAASGGGALFPVAILAGGLATRLRPLTETIPKALVDVHGRPFIAWQLDWLREQGASHVVVCAGYLGERIQTEIGDGRAFGLRVEWVFDGPTLLGTAGALKRALPLIGGPFFVLYGDSYLPIAWQPVQDRFLAGSQPALMTVYRNDGQFDRSNIEFADGRIVLYDKTQVTPRMHHIDYGLGILSPSVFEEVPADGVADLAGLYSRLAARQALAAYEVHQRFYEIGSFEGLEETRSFLARREDGSGPDRRDTLADREDGHRS